jgi:hypothetical protein
MRNFDCFIARIKLGATLVLLTIVTGGLKLQCQTPLVVSSSDHRPLAGALHALEAATKMAINYEDPPYENEMDLEDVSTPKQRAEVPGYRLLVQRTGNRHTTDSVYELRSRLGVPGQHLAEQLPK